MKMNGIWHPDGAFSDRGSAMSEQTLEQIRRLNDELRWLKVEVRRKPTHWAYSRIAEVEGMLAACREDTAWEETRTILKRFMTS
jgi:hypothetical protein